MWIHFDIPGLSSEKCPYLKDEPDNEMSNLQSLPTEIWLRIIASLPQNSLLAFCRTSKKCHEVATPELYRQVWHWADEKFIHEQPYEAEILRGDKMSYSGDPNNVQPATLDKTISIYEPRALSRTLAKSSWICSLVESVDLISHCSRDDDLFYDLLQSLNSSPLRHLHISHACNLFVVPAGIDVTSTAIRGRDLCDKEDLKAAFVLNSSPTVRNMCFYEWGIYERDSSLELKDTIQVSTQTSNITHLSFHRCGVSDQDLEWIMSRPRALRSFKYSIYQEYHPFFPFPSGAQLHRALSLQKATLEEISITKIDCEEYPGPNVQKPVPFNEFPVLKRLRVSLEYLLPGFPIRSVYSGKGYTIYESLPQSLENLDLEYSVQSVFSNQSSEEAVKHDWRRLYRLIEELMINANKHLPRLTNLGIGDIVFSTEDYWEYVRKPEQNDDRASSIDLRSYDGRYMRGFE